jgi:hypothetical protein
VKPYLIAAVVSAAMQFGGAGPASAQSMDDLNLQVHGYATQGFLYTNYNNWDTTGSSDGSAAWTEAVVNISAQPESRLRIGIQARYFLLGNYGNAITMDWAQGDFKLNEYFGVRAGKVKTPAGLLNDSQDIDPAHLWVLLPQGVYPLASRNSVLAHYGAVAYGTLPLGTRLGKIEYHAFGGRRVLAGNDPFFQVQRDQGLILPNGLTGPVLGGAVAWHTPLPGLKLGVSDQFEHPSGEIVAGTLTGTTNDNRLNIPYFFTRYEGRKLMFGGEYNRIPIKATVQFPGLPTFITVKDVRSFYITTSYKASARLTAGMYYGYRYDRRAALGSARYQKDWTLAARYDVNPFLYLKLEQHLMDGTSIGFSSTDNTRLQPGTRMTLLKLGVTF